MVKNYDNILNHFHLLPERNGQMDRQTDRRTDRQTDRIAISILNASVLTRNYKRDDFIPKPSHDADHTPFEGKFLLLGWELP